MSIATAFQLTLWLAGTGICLNALEFLLAHRRIFAFYRWEVLMTKYPSAVRHVAIARILGAIYSRMIFDGLLLLQILAFFGLVLAPTGAQVPWLIILVLFVHLAIHGRLVYGLDGSDQFQTVIWIGLLAYCFISSPEWAMWYITAQFMLSYFTSGFAKIISPTWRSGAAVALVTRTDSYGIRFFRPLLQRRAISWGISWLTMLLEILGPLSVFMGPTSTLIFIACSLAFHIGIALIMGLNSFVWAFASAYPALYFCAHDFQ